MIWMKHHESTFVVNDATFDAIFIDHDVGEVQLIEGTNHRELSRAVFGKKPWPLLPDKAQNKESLD